MIPGGLRLSASRAGVLVVSHPPSHGEATATAGGELLKRFLGIVLASSRGRPGFKRDTLQRERIARAVGVS